MTPLIPVERIALAAPVPQGVLLDAVADFVDHGRAEFYDTERVAGGDPRAAGFAGRSFKAR
jgi:hypothetical protein